MRLQWNRDLFYLYCGCYIIYYIPTIYIWRHCRFHRLLKGRKRVRQILFQSSRLYSEFVLKYLHSIVCLDVGRYVKNCMSKNENVCEIRCFQNVNYLRIKTIRNMVYFNNLLKLKLLVYGDV